MDIVKRQADPADRRKSSLVSEVSRLTGKAVQQQEEKMSRQGEKTVRARAAGKRSPPFWAAPVGEERTDPPRCLAPDGYVRRSPVQPIREIAGYRRRLALRAVGAAALLTALLILLWLVLRTGILAF